MLERTADPVRRATLRSLAGLEARRYARHPLFLAGVMLLVVVTAATSNDGTAATSNTGGRTALEDGVYPAFFLGIFGLFVAHRLTRSTWRARDLVEAAPADGLTRTAAMCFACVVPAATGLLWFGWTQVAWALWPPAHQAHGFGRVGNGARLAIMLAGVIAAFGGPLLGIAIARWLRMQGAALLSVVGLVAWSLATDGVLAADPRSRTRNLLRMTSPHVTWQSGAHGRGIWINAGSPLWRLMYLAALCGLAAVAALLHDAAGHRRNRLVAVGAAVAVVGAGALLLAAFTGPGVIRL